MLHLPCGLTFTMISTKDIHTWSSKNVNHEMNGPEVRSKGTRQFPIKRGFQELFKVHLEILSSSQ
eukprot:c55104_g1_i1 orf=48-242(+)